MKQDSSKKILLEMMHKVGGMPLKENYPMGAEPEYAGDNTIYNQDDDYEANKPDPDEGRDDDLNENNINDALYSGGDKYRYYSIYPNSVVINNLLLSKDSDWKINKSDFEKEIINTDDYSLNLDDNNNVYVETIKNVTPEEAQQYIQKYKEYDEKEARNQVIDKQTQSMESGSYKE